MCGFEGRLAPVPLALRSPVEPGELDHAMVDQRLEAGDRTFHVHLLCPSRNCVHQFVPSSLPNGLSYARADRPGLFVECLHEAE